MRRNMMAAVIVLAMNTIMSTAAPSGCGSTPKETISETAREQRIDAQTTDATGENGKDEENSAEAASGNYGDKTIGFMGVTLNNEYHITLTNGAKVEAKAKGIKIKVQAGDQHTSADAQFGIVGNMIVNKMDGILLIPSSSDGLKSTLTECKKTGIPIIDLNTRLTGESLVNVGLDIPSYGTNNYEGAKLADEYVTKNFGEGTETAILKEIEGQTDAADRYNGFIEGARDTVAVVAEQAVNWEVNQGYTTTQNIINVNPDVGLFFCCNGNMDIGALEAIKKANMQEQIQIIGSDVVSEALNLVENGELLATVA